MKFNLRTEVRKGFLSQASPKMGITQKILNVESRLSGKLEDYVKDDLNCMYLGGLIVGTTTITGLTAILQKKYIEGFGMLATSCLTHKYYRDVKDDLECKAKKLIKEGKNK